MRPSMPLPPRSPRPPRGRPSPPPRDLSQPAADKPALATALPAAALAAVRPVKVKSISLSLKHDDPRWARAGGADADPATTDGAGGKGADLTAFADGDEVPATAALDRFAGDETETAAIGDAAAPDAAPLPTARPDDVTGGGDPALTDAANAADAADAPGRPARIRTAVNLRARPADEASVLTVVPGQYARRSDRLQVLVRDRRRQPPRLCLQELRALDRSAGGCP